MTAQTRTSSTGLAYTLSTNPGYLAAGAETDFTLTVTNPTDAPVSCDGITLRFPTGDSAGALTRTPGSIFAYATNGWQVATSESAGEFDIAPPGEDNSVAPGEEFCLGLRHVHVTDSPGTMVVSVYDGSETRHDFPLKAMPAGFVLENLAPSDASIDLSTQTTKPFTLYWDCSRDDAKYRYTLYYNADGQEQTVPHETLWSQATATPRASGNILDVSFPVGGVKEAVTVFLLEAVTTADHEPYGLTTVVNTFAGGQLTAGNVTVNGTASLRPRPARPATQGGFGNLDSTDGFLSISLLGPVPGSLRVAVDGDPSSPYFFRAPHSGADNATSNALLAIPASTRFKVDRVDGMPDLGNSAVMWFPLG